MEVLTILLLIIILILVVARTGNITAHLEKLEHQIRELHRRLPTDERPQRERREVRHTEVEEEDIKAPKPTPAPIERWAPYVAKLKVEEEKPDLKEEQKEEKAEQTAIPEKAEQPASLEEATTGSTTTTITTPEVPITVTPIYTPPPPVEEKPGFFERNPDLEKFIGENLISKIGIAILVIGIGFFVKYAIDVNWIGEIGRVCIGLLCGGILTGLAHRLHKNYQAFSSVLIGGGLAVFYFSIGLAYHQYHLFSQPVAFTIMVVITIFAIVLSLLYDRQEVAIIALTGGFAVPFMVSNGSGNYVALFTYLLILNIGILVIAYRKGWRLLNGLAFGYTIILFGSWLYTLDYPVKGVVARNGFLFASAFYLLYLGINLAHNIREQRKFIASDFGILLANTAIYFSAGLYLMYLGNAAEYKGIFSAGMGVLNLCLCYYLYRNEKVDKNIFYLITGITLTFVSITAPLQLHGHSITLFWASEAVVLWWLLQQSKIKMLRVGFMAVWSLTIISLVMDWGQVYGSNLILRVIINRAFMTTAFVIASNVALYRLMRDRDEEINRGLPDRNVFGLVVLAFTLIIGVLEINYQFSTRYPGTELPGLYLPLYVMCYAIGLRYLLARKIGETSSLPAIILTINLLIYLAVLKLHVAFQENAILTHQLGGHFIVHWLVTALAIASIYGIVQIQRRPGEDPGFRGGAAWALSAVSVLLVSVEMFIFIEMIMVRNEATMAMVSRNYVRVGLPIVWGLCSFVLMYLGFRHKAKTLRIISLTLFGITLLKLFVFDIANLAPAGKIAAFICLGILLLVVSFMYQRLKKIIVEDAGKKKDTEA